MSKRITPVEPSDALNVRIPSSLKKRLEEEAERTGSARSDVVRLALEAYLQRDEVPVIVPIPSKPGRASSKAASIKELSAVAPRQTAWVPRPLLPAIPENTWKVLRDEETSTVPRGETFNYPDDWTDDTSTIDEG